MTNQSSEVPTVQCMTCKRTAKCVRVKDGTVYKPTAWFYPDESTPMQGVCGACLGLGEAFFASKDGAP